jgi:hypothetical protein
MSVNRESTVIGHVSQYLISAQCKSIQKLHTNHSVTPVALTSTAQRFLMLPGHHGTLQCALRPFKIILRSSRNHLPWLRCIHNTWCRIVDIWSHWHLCADLQQASRAAETSVHALQQTWGRDDTCSENITKHVIWARSHTQTSLTLWQPSPLLLISSKCSQPTLQLF